MELQFHKSVIPCLQTVAREIQNQEQTQELRLTDGMPDIGKVLASWGQILVRSKEWRSGSMGVSGGVMAWVLYMPEEGQEPQSIATWLPFQMKWDFPDVQRDGTITVAPLLRGIDARSVSARKIMVRAGISLLAEGMTQGETEIFAPTEALDDLHILKNTYPIRLPAESGEKAFAIEEALSLPDSQPPLGKIIYYELCPELVEQKIVSDKLVFRGNACLHLLYGDKEGRLHTWDTQIPFSQYAQLNKEYDTDATAQICFALTNLELETGEEENLNLKAGMIAQYVIFEARNVELVEDAYSNLRDVKLQTSQLNIPAQLDCRREAAYAEHTEEQISMQPVDVSFYPDHPRMYREGDTVTGEMSGMFQLLGYDENGELVGGTYHWADEWSFDASHNAKVAVVVQPAGKPQATLSGENMVLRCEMNRDVATTANQGLSMIAGMELGEMKEPDPNRPSLILRRAGEDRLWDLAKKSGSTVEAIQKANNLQGEPESSQMLLIPVS